ncbi:cobalamin biosynthesis protein [Nocardia sp. 2]|uniref:Cobalamin biosynthesis protein n=2 Tax=Nocardia acididurans TaxID=2802282 RepID=A0ABS1MEN0_9NOCA|nr:cobalamin biosynthesis protein [Nocardia acididurans]
MRAGAKSRDITDAVREVLGGSEIVCLATVDRRAGEPGLMEAAALLGVPVVGFASAQLAAVEVPNPSERTAAALGTSSVAEAAAVLAAGGGPLEVEKTVVSGITVAAVAVES